MEHSPHSMNKDVFLLTFQVLVVPPLYRNRPQWYNSNLAQVALRFSASLTSTRPPNLHLLPSFSSQDLMPDGIFLTPVSGLHYVLHIFDQACHCLDLLPAPLEVQHVQVQEVVRLHDDRLAYLESSHGNLIKRVDTKVAVDSEFADWTINRSEEDWFTITGLKRLQIEGEKEWQIAARRQVNDVIKMVLKANKSNLEYSILYVGNPLRYRTVGQNVYNVQMGSVYESRRLRDMYSGFFKHGGRPVQCPTALKGVSLRNKLTLASRVRISILQQIGANYKATNPGSSIQVKGFKSRPLITVQPPRNPTSGSSTRRTFNFVEAVTTLPAALTDENLTKIFQVLGSRHQGELRSIFVVLSDDDRDRCEALAKASHRPGRGPVAPTGSSGPSGASGSSRSFAPTSAQSTSGVVSGPGAGMDLEVGFLASLRHPPPPPPPTPSSPSATSSPPRKTRSSRGRGKKSRKTRKPPREEPARGRERVKRGLKRRHQSDSDQERAHKRSRRSRRSPSSSSGSGSSSDSRSAPEQESGSTSSQSDDRR